jgi:hypothetical protein
LEWLVDSPFIAFSLSIFYFENMSFFLTPSFAILAQHDAMKKGGNASLFYFQLFWFFTFN